ncbi:MAG: class I SAM-dependent methyltransferase [Acidimicrobiia bacterium]|nr:class I SAM-dependent methyltransferase [Acidimicrobiia bacterium]
MESQAPEQRDISAEPTEGTATHPESCRICGATLDGPFLTGGKWRVQACRSCTAASLVPLPTPEVLDEAYHQGGYADERGQVPAPVDRLLDRFSRRRLEFAAGDKRSGRFLEVGSGKGRLLKVARAKGFDPVGIEPHSGRREFGTNRYDIDVFNGPLADFPPERGPFDVIAMWHVLEHVPEPVDFLRQVGKLLADDGRLAIEVPNLRGWARYVTGDAWFPWQLPYHLVHFTPKAMEIALDRAGFEMTSITTRSLEMQILCWSQSVLNRLSGTDELSYRLLKRNWQPESKEDWKDLARLAGAGLGLAVLSPFILAAAAVEADLGGGTVVRVAARKV